MLRIPKTAAGIVEYRPDRVVVEADSPSDGYVFLSDSFYPGWRATVNDRNVSLMRNKETSFRIVSVARGHNRAVFCCQPWSFAVGVLSSLGSLALIAVAWRQGKSVYSSITPIR